MTLEQVRSKTERIREFSALPFLLVAAVSLLGAIYRPAPQIVTGGAINPGDVAWMLTATGLVLLMTPGLSFFYGGMVRTKNVVSTMLQSFVAMALISILWIVVGFSLWIVIMIIFFRWYNTEESGSSLQQATRDLDIELMGLQQQ